ncbi:Cof-type HAD-IIB family hydrolase [Paenibacillus sp. MMS20-IR301]|uniref:Cof-type HAD-IIB family hydrolase n=1 Tax=Paenibacillus sp. MMS20-IR301 TaxID=2895946 RepID=UPI0028E3E772|nr:Cof-type HAD-IIB family hydrolase [Paenibacillus sp. MMS20-IR301]WNS45317.1 Cof-type HAD-IIB family hydrolase [Paenibacillus sp. MMS20-IR301]
MNTNHRKIVFIDIDGTLLTEDGIVPESAQLACRQARANGHLLYLCTGRSKAEIYDSIWEIGFDGLIGAAGGYVETGNEMLYHKKVTPENVRYLVDYFNANNVDFILESNNGLYGSRNLQPHLERRIYGDLLNDPAAQERKLQSPHPYIATLVYGEESMVVDDVNKVCFLESSLPFSQIEAELAERFTAIQCSIPIFGADSGELMIPGIHKASAIADLLVHLNIPVEDSMAIGDGLNDLEMLGFCRVGVAMGNAREQLKAIADDVTDSIEADGLYNCFLKYGLISA